MDDEHRIERESSIEKEPRTLNIHQIHLARELALQVMNTRTTQEAFTIFTEVSEPVNRRAAGSQCQQRRTAIDEEDYEDRESFTHNKGLRDIASAPF